MAIKTANKRRPSKPTLGPDQLQAVGDLFAVLSEPTRLRLLHHLQSGPATVGELVDALEIKQANASKQLAILHDAGVLSRERDGNSVRYAIRMPLVFDLCKIVCDGLIEEAHAKLQRLK